MAVPVHNRLFRCVRLTCRRHTLSLPRSQADKVRRTPAFHDFPSLLLDHHQLHNRCIHTRCARARRDSLASSSAQQLRGDALFRGFTGKLVSSLFHRRKLRDAIKRSFISPNFEAKQTTTSFPRRLRAHRAFFFRFFLTSSLQLFERPALDGGRGDKSMANTLATKTTPRRC